MTKEIWLPIGETKATVVGDKVTVWQEMKMTPRSIATPIGFQKPKEEADAS